MSTANNNNNPFIAIDITRISDSTQRVLMDHQFLLLLNGSLRIRDEAHTFFMESNDVMLCEAGKSYIISGAGNNVVLSILIDRSFFVQGKSLKNGHYICNSALDHSRDYTPLRQLLSHIATSYFENNDMVNLNLLSHAYNLLFYLGSYHYIDAPSKDDFNIPPKYKERMDKILAFMDQNSANPITLQQVADQFNLSAPYLSSFFKQAMNENFNTYLNRIRLEKAVEDLIYSDNTVTTISYQHGFASLNAFNKLFKEHYQMTPKKYMTLRKKERLSQQTSPSNTSIVANSSEHIALLHQLTEKESFSAADIQFPSQTRINIEDMQSSVDIIPIWKKLINVGPLPQLSKRDIERQVLQLQEGIGFEYARVEDILNLEGALQENAPRKILFSTFDRAIDLLTMNNLLPYLELAYPLEYLATGDQSEIHVDSEQFLEIVYQLLMHSANMYGPDVMEKWYFEISYFEHLFAGKYESIDSFILRFQKTYWMIKNFLPNAKVGGICHDAIFSYERYEKILLKLNELGIQPDFLSIGIIPYEYGQDNTTHYSPEGLYYSSDKSYALHQVVKFKNLISSYFSVLPEIHVAFLGLDILNHNFMNDTCFQSTFFFRNTVDLVNEVDMLGYYQLSDIAAQPEESNDFLEGRNGIFNKYGIKKPACHLLEVFSRAHNKLVEKGSDYIVIKGSQERYMIGLANYTYLSDYHRMSILHDNILAVDAYSVYENPQTKYVSIQLNHLHPGVYDVILHQINKNHGSALDEWSRNGFWNRFSREELEYMRKTLQPLKTHQEKTCIDGTMDFQIQLAPHEVLFITLFYRW